MKSIKKSLQVLLNELLSKLDYVDTDNKLSLQEKTVKQFKAALALLTVPSHHRYTNDCISYFYQTIMNLIIENATLKTERNREIINYYSDKVETLKTPIKTSYRQGMK